MKLASRVVHFTCCCLVMFGAVAVLAQERTKTTPEKPETNSLVSSTTKMAREGTPKQKINRAGNCDRVHYRCVEVETHTINGRRRCDRQVQSYGHYNGHSHQGSQPVCLDELCEAKSEAADTGQCRAKIASYVQGSMRARPDVDLNSYYILALNESADISVIDPLLGYGGSKLLTLVMLKSPGEDWVLSNDGEKSS